MKDVTKQLRHRYTIQWMKTFKFILVEKLYAKQSEAKKILNLNYEIWSNMNEKVCQQSEAKKKYIKIKRGPKKLNFGASKPGVRGGARAPRAPPGSAGAFMVTFLSIFSCSLYCSSMILLLIAELVFRSKCLPSCWFSKAMWQFLWRIL